MAWMTLEDSKNTGEAPMKTIWITSPPDPYAVQREAAKKVLGARWVCDKSRHVQRGQYEQRESHGADVAATWQKYRDSLAPKTLIVTEEA